MSTWEVDFDYAGLWISALVVQGEWITIKDIRVYSHEDIDITHLISKAGFMEISAEVQRQYEEQTYA